jgi:polyphosphate kinase
MAMRASETRTLRFEVPDRATFDRLVQSELPAGSAAIETTLEMYRDAYVDTPAEDLKRKSTTLRIRIHDDDRASLLLDVVVPGSPHAPPERRTVEETVPAADAATIFRGASDPARMLRALIDPDRLGIVLEVETLRRTRRFRTEAGEDVALHYDLATVRRSGLSAELFQLELEVPAQSHGIERSIGATLRADYGLRPALAELESRARELAADLEIESLGQAVRAAREVAVLIHHRGALALLERDGQLVVPHGPGDGPQACRRALRAGIGHARARVRLLGTSVGAPGRPALQIWLAEDVARIEPERGVAWVPVDQALERAGAPGLRDARTLRALHVVARSGLGSWTLTALRGRAEQTTGSGPLELVLQRLEAADGVVELSPPNVPPQLLLNMELARMGFDERILVMAEDPATPLLERVRFLGMFGERHDDLFTTRVARFKRMAAAGSTERSMDGLAPTEQLEVIAIRARRMKRRAYALLGQHLIPELAANGIVIESGEQLDADDHAYLARTYGERLQALVMPIVTDPMHPFPHVRNLRPALAATVRLGPDRGEEFVAVELPGDMPRFVPLAGGHRFVPLEDVVKAMLPELYSGLQVLRAHVFRVTRSAHIDLDDDPLDMLETVAEEIARRPFQEVVRLEVEQAMPPEMRLHLLRELQFENEEFASSLDEQDVYTIEGFVDLAALEEIGSLDVPELRFPPMPARDPFPPGRDIFALIADGDRFVQFPDDSFQATVEALLEEAADDPQVVAIKITLYRTSKDSAIIAALQRARSNGKDVLAMVELKASFDEQRNIEWARNLEQAGIRVAFSPPKFKVHAKVALVVRREGESLRRYAYFGTGNLNAATAGSYVDVGVFTADATLTQELNSVFNLLTGYSAGPEIEELLVSPFNMQRRFLRMIQREAEHARAGRPARICMQMNGLADRRLIAALYQASQDGVEIDMMVREICALRPALPGISDHIRVTSLLGRRLQHARIFHFHNAGNDEYYIGSADWRPRNLRERVEIVAPVRDPSHRARLDRMLQDTLYHPDTWVLRPDGTYVRGSEVIGEPQRAVRASQRDPTHQQASPT